MEVMVINSIFLMLNVARKLPNLNLFLDLEIQDVTYLYSLDVEIPSPNSKWPEAFFLLCFWKLQFRIPAHKT